MKFICPLIVVESIEKSRFLYEELLGQQVIADFGENVTFAGDFALHEKKHFLDLIGKKEVLNRPNNLELCFEDNNLKEIETKLKENGFEFVHEIIEQPWKQRVLRFYDYDNHIVEIGESMENVAKRLKKQGFSIVDISKITYIPVENLEHVLK